MHAQPIVQWLHQRMTEAHAAGFVVGLSGGIDSAVVARLCQLAAPDSALGVLLPCHSNPDDARDAKLVADHFKMATVTVTLDGAFDTLVETVKGAASEAERNLATSQPTGEDIRARMPLANLKPRLRMTSLYFIANRLNYLVAGTGNRCELAIGYFTKYGDGGVDLLPIGHLLKSEVRDIARQLGVPQQVIEKPPSAGLWIGQTDESEMGFTYAELEQYLENGSEAVNPAIAMRIERLMRTSDHKRSMPPAPER